MQIQIRITHLLSRAIIAWALVQCAFSSESVAGEGVQEPSSETITLEELVPHCSGELRRLGLVDHFNYVREGTLPASAGQGRRYVELLAMEPNESVVNVVLERLDWLSPERATPLRAWAQQAVLTRRGHILRAAEAILAYDWAWELPLESGLAGFGGPAYDSAHWPTIDDFVDLDCPSVPAALPQVASLFDEEPAQLAMYAKKALWHRLRECPTASSAIVEMARSTDSVELQVMALSAAPSEFTPEQMTEVLDQAENANAFFTPYCVARIRTEWEWRKSWKPLPSGEEALRAILLERDDLYTRHVTVSALRLVYTPWSCRLRFRCAREDPHPEVRERCEGMICK